MSDPTDDVAAPVQLRSASGLTVQVNRNGSIRRIDHGDVILNMYLGNEVEGGPANLYLRRRGTVIESTPLLGPRSPGTIHLDDRGLVVRGEWRHIRFTLSLVLADAAPAWFWRVALENAGTTAVSLDLVYAQDVALAHYGAVRMNEYYVSQYVDLTPLVHAERGVVVAVRQNLAMGERYPWAVIGTLGHGVGFATDGLDLHGRATRAGETPAALTVADLPSRRRQHEHAMAVIQDEALDLAPGAAVTRGFFGWFEAHHPDPTTDADLAFVDRALAVPAAGAPQSERPAGGARPAATLFSTAPPLESEELDDGELTTHFGSERRQVESESGTTLSFFTGTHRHVVLRAKEQRTLRPHGHIMRTGDGLVPDEASLTSTAWMDGVFHSLVTQGHVNINRALSTVRSYLGLLRSGGLRIFVELESGYHVLGIPSAFAMTPAGCVWIYKHADGVVRIESRAATREHVLTLSLEVLGGPPRRFLLSHHVALGGDDGADPVPARVARDGAAVVVRTDPTTDLGRRFPDGFVRIDPEPATTIERVAGDEALFADGRSRRQPFVVLVTAPITSASFRMTAGLTAPPPTAVVDASADHAAEEDLWRDMAGRVTLQSPAVRTIPDDATSWFFRRDDWEALVRVAGPLRAALELADARHHHAYQRAVAILLAETPTLEVERALQRFLEVDADRPLHLRRSAARRLAELGNTIGVPLLAEEAADERDATWVGLPACVMPGVAELLVDGALIGGHFAVSEKRMWEVLEHIKREVDRDFLAELHVRILEGASTNAARRSAARYAVSESLGHRRLERVAEVFAWGIRRGVELSGRLFRIHMTSKERDLGHTRLTGNRIFVSPLPMLRGETHGQDVVEGLVLHEIGHHVYHRSPEAQALWARAHKEGVGHLLNLVADEHLERNLRAIDPEYGDRLKRLGAYAFQHAPQEIAVATLLASLRGASASALIRTPLEVAFNESAVRLRRGAVLGELDRVGHPLARFARALRMGLGNRSGDPRLAAALELVNGLRDFDMQRMYDVTWQLANMFGGVIQVAQVFGGPEGLEFGEREDDVFGSGIDDDALQKEVDRILDPKRNKSKSPAGGDRLWININPDDEFERITNISRVRGNPEAHKRIATQVERHAARLRALLDDLGLRWEPQKARTQGRALDRGRLQALVTRGDPRILIARTPTRRTDLFLGTIVDCSGSMQAGDNIDRARRFAVMVAEAVRPLPGVEARFFGFTNNVIYDAGDARDCGVVGLVADGGNNDAAALLHVANVAMASNKRARVLVMISDGLPTECSVSALRGLVQTLTRRKGIVCAQVAVRALEEVCFPHYVVLDDNAPDVAVARFGRMIGDLARRSLIG